ncbi:hypothetical protein OESDEN_11137 [Oesophagostomum dentatum]|uniref:Uncharacterized protein n=1 Tax=Oesophagostomum dentatum TaxID=61180 RepID=A0A0B1SZW8_OESDE|nr:hypothetical protein OESDEN_11137 [Oesophagostomum dentatum]
MVKAVIKTIGQINQDKTLDNTQNGTKEELDKTQATIQENADKTAANQAALPVSKVSDLKPRGSQELATKSKTNELKAEGPTSIHSAYAATPSEKKKKLAAAKKNKVAPKTEKKEVFVKEPVIQDRVSQIGSMYAEDAKPAQEAF